jgi:probable phosphoglycerate mutase
VIRLRLVRHGEPAWNVDERAVDDPALTERGTQEVAALCQELDGQSFDAFYVSPLRRARQTAEPLARRLGMKAQVCDWLAELAHPDFDGHPWEDVEAAFLAAQTRPPGQWWDGMPGGESFRDFQHRVVTGLEALLAAEHGATTRDVDGYRMWDTPDRQLSLRLVCHGGTSGVVLSHLLDLEVVPWVYERFPLRTGGSAVLETRELSSGEIWMLTSFEGSARLY